MQSETRLGMGGDFCTDGGGVFICARVKTASTAQAHTRLHRGEYKVSIDSS